jgi:hypothetical protein
MSSYQLVLCMTIQDLQIAEAQLYSHSLDLESVAISRGKTGTTMWLRGVAISMSPTSLAMDMLP